MRAFRLALLNLCVCATGQLQAQVTCDIDQRPGAPPAMFSNAGQPTQVTIIPLADIQCTDGKRILADQATASQASGIIQMFGNVQVTDPQRVLRSGNATYYTRQGQLHAVENVVVTQRDNGSVIRADILNYWAQSADRPQSLMIATRTVGPPARAILFGDRAAEPGAPRDSTIVDAAEIQIMGESMFRGTGEAVLTRDSLRATAHQIEYDQQTGNLQILGGGVVTLPSYEMRGDSITATMGEDDQIREVLTRHGSSLQSEDMQVTAPAVRLFFENGGIARMVAMNWQPLPNAVAAPRPVAVSEQFRMEADSLDVLAPEQQLTEAVAIGQAYVERVTPDSLRRYLPEAEENVTRLIENDWMRGDTVRAFFVAGATAEPDPVAAVAVDPGAADAVIEGVGSNGNDRVMERLTAIGGPAQAMHRMRPENSTDDARLSIAYLVGSRVEVLFEGGLVTEVMAAEDVRGIYLQPGEAAQRAATAGPPRRSQ